MRFAPVLSLFLLVGCGDDGGPSNLEELITTVTLTMTPMGGGTAVTASFDDEDGLGGNPPVIDPINLVAAQTYAVTVSFQNRLETPPEEITDEVRDEGEDHQVFFTGTAVNGPASNQPGAPLTHAYTDMDTNGLPIGLASTFATTTGTGTLTVTLRHVPPLNNTPTKTADLATQVRDSGFATLAGSSDASVSFMVTVP